MRIAIAAVLAVVTMPCAAAWEPVGTSEHSGRTTHYIDRDGMRREGDIRRFRTLNDRAAAAPSGMRSWISVDEYNCRTQETRMIRYEAYAEPGGKGTPLMVSNVPVPWVAVGPDSFAANVMRAVCK